jgi:hypothetical protein
MAWRPSSKQWLAFIVTAVFAVLSLLAGSYLMGTLLLVAAAVLVWLLQPRGKPENMVVRSVTCSKCGAPAEPHWARCPKCGEPLVKS